MLFTLSIQHRPFWWVGPEALRPWHAINPHSQRFLKCRYPPWERSAAAALFPARCQWSFWVHPKSVSVELAWRLRAWHAPFSRSATIILGVERFPAGLPRQSAAVTQRRVLDGRWTRNGWVTDGVKDVRWAGDGLEAGWGTCVLTRRRRVFWMRCGR